MAQQWRKAIGWNEMGNTKRGSVCSKHFKDGDVKKKGQKIILNAGSVPSIFPNENDTNFEDEITIEETMIPASEMRCSDCEHNDQNVNTNQIAEYEDRIDRILQLEIKNVQLEKEWSKARSKVYSLESTKIKLKNIIKEMKEQKLKDSKLKRETEVNWKHSQCSISPGCRFQIHFYGYAHVNLIQNAPSGLYIPHALIIIN